MAIAFGANVNKKADLKTETQSQSTVEQPATGMAALATPEVKAAVDTAATLKDRITIMDKELKALKKEFADAEKVFVPLVHEVIAPGDDYTLEGNDRVVKFSAEGQETVISDKEAIYKAFEEHTPGLFFKMCSITVGNVTKILGKTNVKGLVVQSNKKRTVKY